MMIDEPLNEDEIKIVEDLAKDFYENRKIGNEWIFVNYVGDHYSSRIYIAFTQRVNIMQW